MSAAVTSLWHDGLLEPRDDCDVAPARILAADSWLVTDGSALAIELHRGRFRAAVEAAVEAALEAAPSPREVDRFWAAALDAIPREGTWFPRVELREQLGRAQ